MPIKKKSSILKLVFFLIFLGLTLFTIGISYWHWHNVKEGRYTDLAHTASILDRYYEITFHQRELSLISVGRRLLDIKGEDQDKERMQFAKEALHLYDDLLAFGLADPQGQLVLFTGARAGKKLHNLTASPETKRSFEETKSSSGLVIGEAYFYQQIQSWIIPIRVPIRNRQKELMAVNTSGVSLKSMNKELESFHFPSQYRIHLINATYKTTQIYYPYDTIYYAHLLGKDAGIYENPQTIRELNGLTYFQAYNRFEQHSVMGVETKAGKYKHYIVVSAEESILLDDFMVGFGFILPGYLVLSLVTWFAYLYYQKKEKSYQENLRREKDFSSKIITESPTLIIGIGKDGICNFVNPATEKITGYTEAEIIGKDWWHLLYPREEYLRFKRMQNEFIQKGNIKDYEMALTNKKGEKKIISWNFINMYDDAGGLEEIIGFGNDITEKKLAEKKLFEREANLESLFENTNHIIGLFDMESRLVEFNQSFAHYTRITEQLELYPGMDILEKISKPQAELFRGFLKRAMEGEKLSEIVEYPSEQGLYYFLMAYNPIVQDGQITGVSMFVQDITELKNIQNELKAYSEKLEFLVAERTRELESMNEELMNNNEELYAQRETLESTLKDLKETQEQLVKSEKMASLGILAAGVGHEINNPLNFIKGGVQGLEISLQGYLENEDHSDVNSFIEIIHEGVRRATNIVKSLSHFSRQTSAIEEDCHIHQILDNCLTILHNKIKHKVQVIKEYAKEEIIIRGNEGKLHQALLNILQNAEQAIEQEGIIHIKTLTEEGAVKIIVQDNGKGIPPEDLSKISDPFFTTKAPGQGTGLGLSITYHIIEEHKGRIQVESEPNKGSIFTVILPNE